MRLFKIIWKYIKIALEFVGTVNAWILLAIIFIFVVGPVAIIKKIIGLFDSQDKEWWVINKDYDRDFKRQF